jgi:hypothetical protein
MSQTTAINQIEPGALLTTNIYDARSRTLLREGVKLDEKMLDLLKGSGREYVEVDSSTPSTIAKCEVCQSAISLQLPSEKDSIAATWICRECDSIYFGLARSATLAPVDVLLQPTKSISLPEHLERYFKESWTPTEEGAEKRAHERHTVTLPITVVPLDSTFRIMGESIELESQDVSLGGVCLKHVQELGCPYLYVEFSINEERVRRLAQVVRTRRHGAAFEIGCKFLGTVEGHATSPKPICSVPECSNVAACEVFRQNIDPTGELVCEPDDSCSYLCRKHISENERHAKGDRGLKGRVTYPFTNQRKLMGFSIYMPLKEK